jgi:hypothetical protein
VLQTRFARSETFAPAPLPTKSDVRPHVGCPWVNRKRLGGGKIDAIDPFRTLTMSRQTSAYFACGSRNVWRASALSSRLASYTLNRQLFLNRSPFDTAKSSNVWLWPMRMRSPISDRNAVVGVDQGHDLGRQAATRAAYDLILSPPFAPVPRWWTRTGVPSMRTYSKSDRRRAP